MWIRSQDGTRLVNVKRFVCNGKQILNLPDSSLEDDIDVLGEYENEQRAIEVLDDIQKAIAEERKNAEFSNTIAPNYDVDIKYYMPFQMPEK